MDQQLRVQLLDSFTITENGEAIASLSQRERIQSLLGYLIIHRGQDIARAKLAFQLWPESTDAQALTNLRRELHYLKRDLPSFELYLKISKKTLFWDPNSSAEIDVELFETSLQSAQSAEQSDDLKAYRQSLEAAAKLYKGMLLPHLYDEWIPPEQERLQQQAIQALTALVDCLKDEQQYRSAIRYAQQLLRLDNLNEAAYGSLIQLHALSGDRATALRLYHHCMTLIREELGVDPSAQLQSLYEELLHEPESAPTKVIPPASAETIPATIPTAIPTAIQTAIQTDWGEATDVSAFYGREEELATLQHWVMGDRCRLVAILGMGGMGKTTLSVKFAQQVAAHTQLAARTEAEAKAPQGKDSQTAGAFDIVLWRSLRYAPTWEQLMTDLVAVLSQQKETQPTPARLMHWLRESRCLVVLDNIETILQGGEEAGTYLPGYEAYGELFRLFAEGAHQSCLILTSREKPQEVGMFEGMDLPVRSLQLKGSAEVVEAIIQTKGLLGTPEQKQELGDRYDNMPLAVKITASSIQELFDGEIEPFLAEEIHIFNGLRRLLGQQFERLSRLERSIMDWLAINREWTSIPTLVEDLRPPVPRSALLAALESLRWRSLIDKQKGRYTQSPAVMEYVTERLVEQVFQELSQGPESLQSGAQLGTQSGKQSGGPLNELNEPSHGQLNQQLNKLRLHSHALLKATAQDFIRDRQRTVLLAPLLQQLLTHCNGHPNLVNHLRQWIVALQQTQTQDFSSYAAGNIINLLTTAPVDLSQWDFSGLSIQQAYLQTIPLHGVNFAQARLERSVFSTTLSAILDLDWSSDGQFIATADVEGSVKLWNAQSRQLLQSFRGHNNWIHSVAFSPDNRQLASGGAEGTVRLWRINNDIEVRASFTGEAFSEAPNKTPSEVMSESPSEVMILSGHESRVWSVAFSPQIETTEAAEASEVKLASGSEDGTVRLWNLQTGQSVQVLKGHEAGVNSVQWLNAQLLISGSSDKTLRIWSQKGQLLGTVQGHEQGIWSIAVHPLQSGQVLIASGSQDGVIRLWLLPHLDSLKPQTLKKRLNKLECFATLKTASRWIWSLRFCCEAQRLASGHDDGCLYLWDIRSILIELEQSGPQEKMRQHLMETVQCLKGHQSRVWGLAFNPEGDRLVSGSKDQTLHFWDLERGVSLNTLKGYTNWVQTIAFNPKDNTLLAAYEDTTIRQWKPETGEIHQVLQGHQQPVWAIALSPDGNYCASSGEDETVRIWDLETGQLAHQVPGKQGRVWSVTFSPNGQQLAFGRGDHHISLWEFGSEFDSEFDSEFGAEVDSQAIRAPESGSAKLGPQAFQDMVLQQEWVGHRDRLWSLAFSPDGQTLASSSSDGTIRLWDTNTGDCLQTLKGHRGWVFCVCWSPDGQTLASSSSDGTICLWEPNSGECRAQLKSQTKLILSVQFSPDGSQLVSGSDDNRVCLWDIASQTCLQTYVGHRGWVWSVAFSPDGKTVASGSQDTGIHLWDVSTGKLLQKLRPTRPYEGMNLAGATGLTSGQRETLQFLGAIVS